MGHISHIKVMSAWVLALTVLSLAEGAAARRKFVHCQPGLTYWDPVSENCLDCTRCLKENSVLRPCEVHRDSLCGPLSELFSWPWFNNNNNKEIKVSDAQELWDIKNDIEIEEENIRREMELAESSGLSNDRHSAKDAMWTWDWQAGVLTAAILAAILFFVVAVGYSVHHARQWRILEENFDADVEELSTRLALISAGHPSSSFSSGHAHSGRASHLNELTQDIRCAHLERLLAGKGSLRHPVGANVYIQESGNKT